MSSDADTGTRRSKPRELLADPIGPGSLTWTHFGDVRGLLYLGRAGTLQNMHPAVSERCKIIRTSSTIRSTACSAHFLPSTGSCTTGPKRAQHARSQLPHRSQRNRRNRRALPRPRS